MDRVAQEGPLAETAGQTGAEAIFCGATGFDLDPIMRGGHVQGIIYRLTLHG